MGRDYLGYAETHGSDHAYGLRTKDGAVKIKKMVGRPASGSAEDIAAWAFAQRDGAKAKLPDMAQDDAVVPRSLHLSRPALGNLARMAVGLSQLEGDALTAECAKADEAFAASVARVQAIADGAAAVAATAAAADEAAAFDARKAEALRPIRARTPKQPA